MDKKALIIALGAFLAVLFLSTIGSSLTGFAVLDQSKITLKNYPYPFIKNNVYNDLYIVIPTEYTAAEQLAAIRIANSLKTTQPLLPRIVTSISVPEGDHNLILVGNPCNNELIANELDTSRCSLNLKSSEGLIQLVNHRRSSSLIISGSVEKASKVLANNNLYPLFGTKIIIKGEKTLTLQYN